ncbi:MAG: ATP-binding protein [Synergistaceae bacterium]|nr:ATP-binding protein [Synergistaceae bacterium]
MTLVLAVLVLVVAVNCCFMIYLIADVTTHSSRAEHEPGNVFGLGLISFFQFLLSTFGISDFAVGAAVYSKLKWVPAKKLPGTVNTAAVIPVAVMALIYITSIKVDLVTLTVPIIAQVAGAYISVRFVVKMPLRAIRIFLSFGMLVTVLRVAVEGFEIFPAGGTVEALDTGRLIVLGCLCIMYGALNNLGLGSFAPTLATVYALGLNPEVAFPIMMGAATFSVPIASIQFIKYGSYSRKITVISAVCGTLGVLAAAFVIRDMDISPLKWLVAAYLLYSACSMFISALKNKEDSVAAPRAEKKEARLSIVGRLTSFCLVLILLCTVSLIFISVRNFHIISSDYAEMSISEHNARLRDGVHAYLREHENVLLSARAGVALFMSQKPVDLEQLREYLEETSAVLEDISTLYCTTNVVWNEPGGYAVFSRPWEITEDWNNTERPWFIAAKKTQGRRIAYSKPYIDAITGDIILDISINVNDEGGNDIGVVSQSITIEALSAMLRNAASLEEQQVFLIDSDGIYVVDPDNNMTARGDFFQEYGLEEYRDIILSAGNFSAAVNDMMVYSSSIPTAGWFVVSMIPDDKIFSSVNDHIISIFLTPMLIIFFMLLVVLISLLIIIRRESTDKLTAERITREKDYFIARMSHEIRTPMNSVIGMSELAQRDYGTPRGLEYISGIKNAGASLLAIINDILDFSKIESGRLEFTSEPYETASMLNDVLTIIRVQLGEKPLKLIVDSAPGIPRGMAGDAGRVKQVLLNLLSNAVKYTNEGTILFRLSASGAFEASGEPGNTALLTFVVEDSGIGIKPEDMPKLFGDFSRVDEKRNSSVEGTGLGLSIARSLCRAMGGDITVSSEYGKGSVFTATLTQTVTDWEPIGDAAAISAARSKAQRVTFIAPDAEVLVVDDFPNNLVVTEGLLRPYKMRVFTCLNGREAVELVKSRSFDLVLMDHMMPEMDGMEAAQAIRGLGESGFHSGGNFAELPIVVLTAHAVSGMKEMFLAGGFDDFLSKPIETDSLDAMLKRWIPETKQQPVSVPAQRAEPVSPPVFAGAAKAELDAQRLDLLNHYRWHFENGLPTDEAYCEKFGSLVETIAANVKIPPDLNLAAAELAAAGRRGDADKIRQLLPEIYDALKTAARKPETWAAPMREEKNLEDTLARLKAALDNGDGKSADAAMNELRAMDDLSAPMRELYFFLYDALLMGETEKAAGGLAVWLKFFGQKAAIVR